MAGIRAEGGSSIVMDRCMFANNGVDISVDKTSSIHVKNSLLTSRRTIEVSGDDAPLQDPPPPLKPPRGSRTGWTRGAEKNWPFPSMETPVGIKFEGNKVRAQTFLRGPATVDFEGRDNDIHAEVVFDLSQHHEIDVIFSDFHAKGSIPSNASIEEFRKIVAVACERPSAESLGDTLSRDPTWVRWIDLGASAATLVPALSEIVKRGL